MDFHMIRLSHGDNNLWWPANKNKSLWNTHLYIFDTHDSIGYVYLYINYYSACAYLGFKLTTSWFIVFPSSCHACNGFRPLLRRSRKDRTNTQRGKCSSYFLSKLNTTQTENETVLCGKHRRRKQSPTTKMGENRLPTYDSQSETTIDSCLWLRTIPGQTQKYNIEKEQTTHPNSHPDQTNTMT